MLLPSEQVSLKHAGLSPQAIKTLGAVEGARASIAARSAGDGSTAAGSTTGGAAVFQNGLVYANTTVPAGNTVANTNVATIFSSKYNFPSNSVQVGDVIFVKAWGVYGTAAVAPTLTLNLMWAGTQLLSTTAITNVINLTNSGWSLEAQIHVLTLGGAGTFEAQGITFLSTGLTTDQVVDMTNTAPVTVNTALIRALQLSATWSAASASNTITLRNFSIRVEQAQNFG